MAEPDEIIEIPFGTLECGFFRLSYNPDQTYFAMPHGKFTFCFPVIDGKISRGGRTPSIFPNEKVQIVTAARMIELGLPLDTVESLNDPILWN